MIVVCLSLKLHLKLHEASKWAKQREVRKNIQKYLPVSAKMDIKRENRKKHPKAIINN